MSLWAYSEIIRSDIPGSSGAEPARLPVLRPSPPSVMKPSLPPVSKSSSFLLWSLLSEAHSRRASSPPRGAGKEEKEHKAKNSSFP